MILVQPIFWHPCVAHDASCMQAALGSAVVELGMMAAEYIAMMGSSTDSGGTGSAAAVEAAPLAEATSMEMACRPRVCVGAPNIRGRPRPGGRRRAGHGGCD